MSARAFTPAEYYSSPLTTSIYLSINQDAVDRAILDLTTPAPAANIIPLPAVVA